MLDLTMAGVPAVAVFRERISVRPAKRFMSNPIPPS
jgi:hypothetical protein